MTKIKIDNWTLCHDCGVPCLLPQPAAGGVARCPRCGAELARHHAGGLQRPLALALTGLVLFVIALFYPLLVMKLGGRALGNTLWDGVVAMTREGMPDLAVLVFLTSMLFPFLWLAGLVHLLLPLHLGRQPWQGRWILRMVLAVSNGSMVGIFMLGLFVAQVKLASMAGMAPGIALFALFALLIVIAATRASLDTRLVWERLAPHPLPAPPANRFDASAWIQCHACGLIVARATAHGQPCPRCHHTLHPRKPATLSRTWALLCAAAVLYIPANLYPVMTVIRMGRGQPDTILSGVKHLIESGMWPLALLVFVASIVIPVAKILILGFLLISIQRRSNTRCRDRTILYRVLEGFGHWSMVDVFLVSILTALVDFGVLAQIKPGIGASYFAAVVVLTLFATHVFDPRLIWDPLNEPAHEPC
ncbi:MAG: paraquat-inducible protein A [Magnetococcus sp. YQC-9]